MDGGSQNIDNVTPTAASETPTDVSASEPETKKAVDQSFLSWTGQSFNYQEKGAKWYMIAGLVVLAICGYFVWQQDWFSLAITIIISAVLFWYTTTVRPREVNYELTNFGVRAGDRFYQYNEIHSFWIIFNDKVKTLNLVLSKKYLPTLTVDLSDTDPNRVRLILGRKLPEQNDRTENILDRLVRTLQL